LNGSYGYGSKPHAVTSAGSTSYTYDSNGNMATRGNQTLNWNVENQLVSISTGGSSSKAISFNGTTSYVDIPGNALKVGESQGSSASYEFWINTTYTDAAAMMSKGSIFPYIYDDGWLCCDFYYNGADDWYGDSGTQINDGEWHYIALTHNGTISKIYVDEVLKDSHTSNARLADTGSNSLVLGCSLWGGYYFPGQLDDIRVSSIARTQTEITNTWNSGNGTAFTVDGSTVALYHCDDQASVLTDSSANDLDGTLTDISYTTGFPFGGGGGGSTIATFVYDGDGNRIKKTQDGSTILYVNQYYEKNLTSGVVTSHYYLGGKEVAVKVSSTVSYIHQDLLGSTSVTSQAGDVSTSLIKYAPFGTQRSVSGTLPMDKLFTGQRRDISTAGSELYYYGARYYDPQIGRFINADPIVPDWMNPQALNRYSYVLNNPLKYTDPTGHGWWSIVTDIASIAFDIGQLVYEPSWGNAGWLALDVALTCCFLQVEIPTFAKHFPRRQWGKLSQSKVIHLLYYFLHYIHCLSPDSRIRLLWPGNKSRWQWCSTRSRMAPVICSS
jgi:RHS repeat-associated protein